MVRQSFIIIPGTCSVKDVTKKGGRPGNGGIIR